MLVKRNRNRKPEVHQVGLDIVILGREPERTDAGGSSSGAQNLAEGRIFVFASRLPVERLAKAAIIQTSLIDAYIARQ